MITVIALVSTMLLYKQSVAKQDRNIVYMKMEGSLVNTERN